MRSVFPRIAVMLRNIHFGGALSGIDSIFFSQSTFGIPGPKRLTSTPSPASTAPAASTASTFLIP